MFIHPDVTRLLTEERLRDAERRARLRPRREPERRTVRPVFGRG
jgi:hypothetical protein